MTDPYQVLGISQNSTDSQVKTAYRELARKYHPDNYVNNPLADLAQEKMKQINEAYDAIQRQRKQQTSGGYKNNTSYTSDTSYSAGNAAYEPNSEFADIRTLIQTKRISEAEELLEGVPQQQRNAEWCFLRGNVFYTRGWLDEAYKSFVRATQLAPGNQEYQSALNQVLWQRNSARPSGNFTGGDYRTTQMGGCSCCDICTGLMCMNMCCDCGGDIFSCC